MLKRLAASLCAIASLAGPVLAQSSCEPAKLAEAIDRYALEPFSARSWRVLQGLGDPMIDTSYQGADIWYRQERWKKLAADIVPDQKSLQDIGWDCRIGYPLDVLEKRIGSLGRDNAYLKQWLFVQDKVMQACNAQGADDIALPPPLDIGPAFANLQKQDRAYQEASIAFYRNKERALPLFRAIAASTSLHKAAARYNTANLLANARKIAEARAETGAILADPMLASIHAITRELQGYIANLEDTAEGWTGLIERDVAVIETPADKILASGNLKRGYASALYDIDFAGVRGKTDDWWLDARLPENPTISKALVDMSRKHPMVLWMIAGQSSDEAYRQMPWSLIGEKWQARMTSYVDRVLAVQPSGAGIKGPALAMLTAQKAMPDEASRKALWGAAKSAMAAAGKTCGSGPETAAAGYLLAHAVRLSAMSGNFEEAYAGLETAPFKPARAYYELALLKFGQFLVGQGNAVEARKLRDRLIKPQVLEIMPPFQRSSFADLLGWIAEDEAHWKQAVALHTDPASNLVFNLLPSKALWAYADDVLFGGAERALFARAAWTRDYALGRSPTKEQTDKLHALNPAMREIAAKVAADYPKAGPERARLLTILRSPRHNILVAGPTGWVPASLKQDNFADLDSWDHNDKNWWCPLETGRQLGALREQFDQTADVRWIEDYWQKRLDAVYDPALREAVNKGREAILKQHPVLKTVSWKEISALAAMASAPKRLTQAAIRWGKASKGGDGAPEALALAVKATRYGCNWHGRHGSYSKAAQQLLQKKFKDTAWAAQTPYWFDCERQEWDKDYNKVAVCDAKTWPKQPLIK